MIVAILGILDAIAGLLLALGGMPILSGNSIVFFIAIAMIVKGIYSWIAACTKNYKLDFFGFLDIGTGLLLLLTFGGFFFFFFAYIGIIEIIKGAYSFMVGSMKN